ncbi:ankyrin and armadillo repeat-containing protein-like [Pecten maximus]|uniref:ankyrin and armadillo repeat-containing protein-like n=1 Tax=Pecten maximus TaxID=6579 RepID=UPI00145909C2|nr:ankyrin and armadillo repeat-containing protein-like [Pecten maximus]
MADEFDAAGWAQIHHAAQRGFTKSITFFLSDDASLMELETTDELHLTPFLCAVDGGKEDSIKLLMEQGANVEALSALNHGAIEICANKFYIELLEYFMNLDDPRIPVWKHLLRYVSSEADEEAEAAGKCLRTLTQGSEEGGINPNWEQFYKHGGIPTIVKVAKGSSIADEAKIPAFQTLLNVIEKHEVKEQVISSGGVPTFIKLLKSPCNHVIQLSAEILKEMATEKQYADVESQNNAIQTLVKVMQTVRDEEVLVQVLECLGNIAEANTKLKSQVGTCPGCIPTIVGLFENQKDRNLLHSLARVVGKIADKDEVNQNSFQENGVTPHIVVLTATRNREIQVSAVEAISKVADNNKKTQKAILADNVQEHLLRLLKNTRAKIVLEKTALALWSLAGSDFDIRRYMAERMEVNLMIEFVNSLSENLQYIGAEGLSVLAQGPLTYQSEIARLNGIAPLGRLIQSNQEYIILSVVRSIRHLCVGVAYVPHKPNQNTILQFRGIKYLVALMVHSENENIQVESALTLGCVSMCNQAALDDIYQNIDFSYVRIVKMMYSSIPEVRLLAGSALAAFAYNNINQQKRIADQGGVRFNCFVPFLQSDDEFFRCNAAFQVVVLSKIIPDEEQALSSAAGIKLLIDLLQDSTSNETLALATDCVARLGHTRAGVPSAMVSIHAVEHLCSLLQHKAEQVRGNAAIALGYLSYNHSAERQLLNRCRSSPYLIRVLLYYTKQSKISPAFLESWKHYKKIGLPSIPEGRPSLIGFKPEGINENRPITMLSLDESNANTRSLSNLMADDGGVTGRSSRMTNTAATPRMSNTPLQPIDTNLSASQISLDSQKSSNSLMQQEVLAAE